MDAWSDADLQALLRREPERGWRAFIDRYTPLIVGLIRRAGVVERDEVMEIYTLMCEQLAADGYRRLKSQDAARGSLGGFLAVLARHTAVDWVRSRKGRRRLFGAIKDLPALEQFVFEAFYWNGRSPSEIVELRRQAGERVDLADIMNALSRVQTTLTDRHRAELAGLAIRSKTPAALDDTDAAERLPDPKLDPESAARIRELNGQIETAIADLSDEDAAIVRLTYMEGLSTAEVARALSVDDLSTRRLQDILDRLRAALTKVGVGKDAVAFGPHVSLDRSPAT